jgi:hypothetical protein
MFFPEINVCFLKAKQDTSMPSSCQQSDEGLSKYAVNRESHHQMTQKFAQLYKTLYKVENKQNTVYKNMRPLHER